MFNIQQMALNLIANNPNIKNNPQAQNYIRIIQSGDSQKGTEIARNICASYGKTPEQATEEAKRFFGI